MYLGCSKSSCKSKAGMTLLEVTIALAIWLALSASLLAVWQHVSVSSASILERQSAFENARGSLDAILMNLQMSNRIELSTDAQGNLSSLTLTQRDRYGQLHNYVFSMGANQRLLFGTQEFASNIASIVITTDDMLRRMYVTITTGCEYPITLNGTGDIRYKTVVVLP